MTKVKICGLSTKEAVEAACQTGADYIGFVFAKSKRQVSLEQARDLRQYVSGKTKVVGVFVSPSLAQLQEAITAVPLDLVQIHGDVDEDWFEELSVPSIRAIQVTKESVTYTTKADYILFDAPVAGSGQTFDWEQLKKQHVPQPYFIAGGLTVENVEAVKKHFSAYALDVSSGVETDGKKDVNKIKAFIERVTYDL